MILGISTVLLKTCVKRDTAEIAGRDGHTWQQDGITHGDEIFVRWGLLLCRGLPVVKREIVAGKGRRLSSCC